MHLLCWVGNLNLNLTGTMQTKQTYKAHTLKPNSKQLFALLFASCAADSTHCAVQQLVCVVLHDAAVHHELICVATRLLLLRIVDSQPFVKAQLKK
jgi:hypothetical protein